MKAFLDTSALIKKYVEEEGSDRLDGILEKISEIVVSPICWLELHSAIERRRREKTLGIQEADWLSREIKKDFQYFHQVIFDESLQQGALELIQKYGLKTLDSLQLASGLLAKPEVFLTSDKKLFNTSKKILANVKLI